MQGVLDLNFRFNIFVRLEKGAADGEIKDNSEDYEEIIVVDSVVICSASMFYRGVYYLM